MYDFNIGLIQYSKNVDSINLLDAMFTNFLIPYILNPSHPKTLNR